MKFNTQNIKNKVFYRLALAKAILLGFIGLIFTTTAYANPSNTNNVIFSATTDPTQGQGNVIMGDINIIINILSGIIGVIIVIVIVIGGIQYIAAGDNPQAVSSAKSKIYNAILALVAFIFLFAFLNWLVPGGLLK